MIASTNSGDLSIVEFLIKKGAPDPFGVSYYIKDENFRKKIESQKGYQTLELEESDSE